MYNDSQIKTSNLTFFKVELFFGCFLNLNLFQQYRQHKKKKKKHKPQENETTKFSNIQFPKTK